MMDPPATEALNTLKAIIQPLLYAFIIAKNTTSRTEQPGFRPLNCALKIAQGEDNMHATQGVCMVYTDVSGIQIC